jgi:hypothetical protein
MQVLLDFLSIFSGARGMRWIGAAIGLGVLIWLGAGYLDQRSKVNATATQLEAALPAPRAGWSAPSIEHTNEGPDAVRVAAKYRRGAETITVTIQTVIFALPSKPEEFAARAKVIAGAVASVETVEGRPANVMVAPMFSTAIIHVGNRAIVSVSFIRFGSGGEANLDAVKADLIGYLGGVNYGALEAAAKPRN